MDDIKRLAARHGAEDVAARYLNFTRYTPPTAPTPPNARQLPLERVFAILAAKRPTLEP